MNETMNSTNGNSLNLATTDPTSSPSISLVPAPLSDLQRRAAMFGVAPDPDLAAKIEEASESLGFLTSAHEDLLNDIAGMRQARLDLIRKAVRAIASGSGLNLVEERHELAKVPGFLATLEAIDDEVELQMAELSARLARLQERMNEFLKAATSIAEREARDRYHRFKSGLAPRPVVDTTTLPGDRGTLWFTCSSCEGTIGQVDVSKLDDGLTAGAFTDPTGRRAFEGDGDYRNWQCPACGSLPIKNPEWILTDSWCFLPVGTRGREHPGMRIPRKPGQESKAHPDPRVSH